jgi:phosphoenolpyruvate synthase/pyruvate phosphate dikinase
MTDMADAGRLRDLEARAEAAYTKMYDAHDATEVAARYSDAKEALYDAIGLARNLGKAAAVARLEERLAHIKAVFRSQFAGIG